MEKTDMRLFDIAGMVGVILAGAVLVLSLCGMFLIIWG
jgi:hypothetical protein